MISRYLQCCVMVMFLSMLLWLPAALAVKGHKTFTSSNTYSHYIEKSFGLAEQGVIELTYYMSVEDPTLPYDSYLLLLVLTEKEKAGWYAAVETSSYSSVTNLATVCTSPSWKRILVTEENTKANKGYFNLTIGTDPLSGYSGTSSDQFTLLAVQCRDSIAGNDVTFHVHYEMKNARPSGSSSSTSGQASAQDYSHLAIEEVMLVRFYGGAIIIYTMFTIGMAAMVHMGRNYTLPIHWLFLATVVSYLLLTICQYVDLYNYNTHGKIEHTSDLATKIFVVISDTLSLASLFLLSLGWCILRGSLSLKEKKTVFYSVGSYFIFGIGYASCNDSQDNAVCEGLGLVSFIIKSLLLLSIIIAMNFTVTQLKAMLNHTPWVPSTPIQYARCKQYQVFRVLFILYLLLPTAFLIVQVTTYSWREYWVYIALNEVLTMFLLYHIGSTFSPLNEPLLVRAFDGSLQRPRTD